MNILFLIHPYPNYVPDLLLHGLRKLLGSSVVEYPRKDCLYEGVLGLGICPDEQKSSGWFPDDNDIDRSDIQEKIINGFFQYIILDVRAMESATHLLSNAKYKGLAIIDGEDKPVPMKPGSFLFFQRETDGSDFGIPLPMAMPEEIFNDIKQFDDKQKKYSVGFIGSLSDQQGFRERVVTALMKDFPDGLFMTSGIANKDDQSPEGRLGKQEYYSKLQQCESLITLRGAGFDTFRYWEHTACRSVNIVENMPLYIPSPFIQGEHQFFTDHTTDIVDTVRLVHEQADMAKAIVDREREHLLANHMTTHRAKYFLDKMMATYE